ncbi:putative oligopeptide transporter [Melampsora larici-populina 98AG31]|uniref:Putative oligopeptide transporter n=1 Tax=Melampsora larici-populina (strain 98AG31 / pathotype 3-4-7) TaxID=747676 RepID=F4RMQ7_MELLP|nr:putative oligopeptide transporter [Melampsora larici-populina 98AG31]EGG06337.1 putative oligopeptide transporter [Melampsora larici-populina 98AG31]
MISSGKADYRPVSDHISDEELEDEDGILLQSLSIHGELRPASPTRIGSAAYPKDHSNEDLMTKVDEDDPARMVAKVVPETDDPTLTTLTFRVWLIGGILGGIGAGVQQIFFFKSNGVGFGGFFIILVSYPLGKLLARILPKRSIGCPNPFGWWSSASGDSSRWLARIELNPGEFSIKEHLLIGVLAGCAASAAYAGDIVAQDMGHFGSLLLILSTQLLGFGLAGFTYSILIRPTAMVWPSSLVVVTLYNTLHSVGGDTEEGRKLTRDRMKFFAIVFFQTSSYGYCSSKYIDKFARLIQFIPSVIAPTLTSISVLCIINNRSAFMRVLGSAFALTFYFYVRLHALALDTGAGLMTFSLDWTVIGSSGSLFTPFFSSLNFFIGMIISMWILVPLMWYKNFWNNQSFGDNAVSARLYDQNYQKYNVAAVVKPDFTLDEAKFAGEGNQLGASFTSILDNLTSLSGNSTELGPIQLTPYFAISYGISFAVLTSAVVTVFLFHWEDISSALSDRHKRSSDVHVEMVERNYGNVPWTWYAWVGGTMFLASVFVVMVYPLQDLRASTVSQCPVWALLLALGMGIIKATTNTQIGLNVITEFVAGILLPGRPLANVTFKVYGYMTMSQCLDLASDLKLGIYAKIPPKDMFLCQIVGTSVGAVINYVFIRSVIADKRAMLDGTVEDPTGQWTGRKPEIFYSASVIWGLIGPIRFFAGKYRTLFWGFPIGAILPFIPWVLAKWYPRVQWKKLSIPLLLHGSIIPPQIPTNIITCGLLAAFFSQYWALRYRPKWFEKYNYVLSSALDAGTSINALTIYVLSIQGSESWWNPKIDAEHCKVGS